MAMDAPTLDRLDRELAAVTSRALDAEVLGERLTQYFTWCQDRLSAAAEKVAEIEAAATARRQAAEAMNDLHDLQHGEVFRPEVFDQVNLTIFASGLQKAVDDLDWHREQAQSWNWRAGEFYADSIAAVSTVAEFASGLRQDLAVNGSNIERIRSATSIPIATNIASSIERWAKERSAAAATASKDWNTFIDESGGRDKPYLTMHVAYAKAIGIIASGLVAVHVISLELNRPLASV
ncbi:MAG TPA: hypothetical protein VIP77_25645 [Jiangellaceae bacterium]